jgi:hypothetical protein
MTSLSEVYEGGVRTVVDRRQRWLGMSLFVVGVAMVVGAISIATTDLSAWFGFDYVEARARAGVLAGLGLPAVFVGIFAVLPTSSTTRASAAIGASLAIFGVVLFTYAYPEQWLSNDPAFALATIVVYAAGTLLTFWSLFVAIATFKTRNDPGGTARVEITEEGKVRVITGGSSTAGDGGSTPSIPGFGSVGLFGSDPDGSVPTQTNEGSSGSTTGRSSGSYSTGGSGSYSSGGGTHPAQSKSTGSGSSTGSQTTSHSTSSGTEDIVVAEPTSDGGSAVTDQSGTKTQSLDAASERGKPDEYCGNCAHFEYVRVDGDIRPYCGLRDNVMDDMDACREWEQQESDTLPR